MDLLKYRNQRVLIAGCNKLALGICVCLLKASHEVDLLVNGLTNELTALDTYRQDMLEYEGEILNIERLNIVSSISPDTTYDLAIAITAEDVNIKTAVIEKLDAQLEPTVIIAINSESIPLSTLQNASRHPSRLICVNWAEPAHTTFFLEIITNSLTSPEMAETLYSTAKECWSKDPYLIKTDLGIRSKMMCALIREAFFLVENGYVTLEDIDRACRNDAGYYLPFAGNFRYMDLMGTFMYGIVMQDLNPELSKHTNLPGFYKELVAGNSKGMSDGKGFYNYEPGEAEQWEKAFNKFSYEIRHIISKYASIHQQEVPQVNA
jgi:3-hydroxybutyryl-CoA dehydrogenase